MMKKISMRDKLITAFAAFTLSNSVIINFFNYNAMENYGAIISTYSLSLMTIISLLLVVKEKKYLLSSLVVALSLYILVLYERHVDMYHTVKEFESGFFIHGLGGFIIGLTIKKSELFIKYITNFSIVYILILILEPITHSILHMSEMLTGYLMTGLTLNLVLAYYTVYKKNRFILCEAIVSTVIITLFSSRGCGLALVSAWCFFYFWDRSRQGFAIRKILTKFVFLASLLCILMMFLINYILNSGIELDSGSLLEKISNGYVNSSNGRDDVWDVGFSLLFQAPFTGMGFGADRTIAEEFFVHNIFLELCINFGIPLACLILLVYWRTILKGLRVNNYSFVSCLIVAQIFKTWIQLLFSSSYLYTMLPLMFIMGLSMKALLNQNNVCNE